MSYAELHAKTNFSFLEGASHPEELVHRAAKLGYAAIAIADRNSLAGVVRAHGAAKELGLKLLVGAEITPCDAPPAVLLATDRAAYGRLARLITRGRRRAEKGACQLTFDDLAEHAAGLIAGVMPGQSERQGGRFPLDRGKETGPCFRPTLCPQNASFRRKMDQSPATKLGPAPREWESWLHAYREAFADHCYLLAELHHGPDDQGKLQRLLELSRRTRVPLAAAGDVYYHVPERQTLCDVLTAIRLGCTVAAAGEHLFPNAERYLRPPEKMAAWFAAAPEAVGRTLEIARRCTFSLDELRYEYPEELAPPGETPHEYLSRMTWDGAHSRYPHGVPEKVRQLLEHELALIAELRYEAYFLTVWDLVRFARSRGILCQGRGSAANSAVCYCLGITAVDPEQTDLLFERFVSRERNEAPDIDVDFEHERREEVIQYLYNKYGRDRAGITGEVITYRPRSAIRDVGKALGFPLDSIDRLTKQLEHFHREPDWPARCREAGINLDTLPGRQLVELAELLLGFPRHLSQHTGGMVITQGPLCELVPIENAAMPDRTVIQWNKDDLDELGILKVDCLALGILTAIRKNFELVEQHHGEKLSLASIPEGDEAVYAMICRADTMGVFQIESRAQMSMLPRLRPRCFYDLVIEVALVRPGPIQGNMVHPYLRRRNGDEPVEFPNAAIRRVLEKTLGVPLFQEQAMRLAVVAAGFTPGEADQLRRAMGAWRRPGLIDQFHKKLIDGMQARGFSSEYAESVFHQIRGFGDYGFPESHAASFALLAYSSAWLKRHYPAAFTAALLNSQPMGFYAPAQLVGCARQHGVEVRPVDVNFSHGDCTLEDGGASQWSSDENRTVPFPAPSMALRLGFNMLCGMSSCNAEIIVHARGLEPFRSLDDFAHRTGLGRGVLVRLAKAGVFGSLGLDRRDSVWHALAQDKKKLPLFESNASAAQTHGCSEDADCKNNVAREAQIGTDLCTAPRCDWLPQMSAAEEVLADYRMLGLSLRGHPMAFLRAELDSLGVTPAARLKLCGNHRPVVVAGIVLVRQRPSTAKGITFVTLEDETGTANLIIRPEVWKRYRPAAMGATLLLVRGCLQSQDEVIHVLVTKLENLSARLAGMGSQSRDFC
jgi:error-prone DNA polymerase